MALRRLASPVLAALALLLLSTHINAEQGKPLSEEALSTLVDQQIPDDVIIKKIEKTGVGFAVDAAALERLQKAGASRAVLAALRQAGQPANAVTYQGVLKMLRDGGEAEVLRRLESSPTTLVLDDEQVAALKKAGASEKLLNALQSNRNPVGTGSDITDFAVVLDCSGSMNDKTPDGVSKMDGAKKVVTKFIRDLPTSKRLAFIVYGTEPTKYKCQDVHVVQPLAPLTDEVKDSLEKYIGELEPAGWTPLALGMATAGKELAKAKGLCQLIVVTDGMETCKGSPGDVAEELTKNLNLPGGVDIIGFGVEPDEKAALYALEKKGKFNLYKAEEGLEDLQAKVREAQERAEREAKRRADALAVKKREQEEKDAQARKFKEDEEKRIAAKLKEDEDTKKKDEAAEKEDFPGPETIKWDVKKLEDAPDDYTIVKRKFDEKANAVVWVIKPKSVKATKQLDTAGTIFPQGIWTARFLDENGIEIKRVGLHQQPTGHGTTPAGIRTGDPVGLTLPLDEDVMKKTRTVIVETR